MFLHTPNDFRLSAFIKSSLIEDIGPRDLTTDSIIPEDSRSGADLILKEDAILSGMEVFWAVFRELDPRASFITEYRDGDRLSKGTRLGKIECKARSILSGERTALNILQRMCGIATLTARYVEKTCGTKAQIIDTRKTIPGLRALDKYAVTCGGGRNHRFGLFDGVLIKDNHIQAAGSIKNAVELVRKNSSHLQSVEVETRSLKEVEMALEASVETIMLDNMSIEEVKTCVLKIGGRAKVEVSGGISLDNVREYALSGPDFISVGALTHSVPGVDISLKINECSFAK